MPDLELGLMLWALGFTLGYELARYSNEDLEPEAQRFSIFC